MASKTPCIGLEVVPGRIYVDDAYTEMSKVTEFKEQRTISAQAGRMLTRGKGMRSATLVFRGKGGIGVLTVWTKLR